MALRREPLRVPAARDLPLGDPHGQEGGGAPGSTRPETWRKQTRGDPASVSGSHAWAERGRGRRKGQGIEKESAEEAGPVSSGDRRKSGSGGKGFLNLVSRVVLRSQLGRWLLREQATLSATHSPSPRSAAARRGPSAALLEVLSRRTPNHPLPRARAQTRGARHSRIVLALRVLCGLWNVINTRRDSMLCLESKSCWWVRRVDASG